MRKSVFLFAAICVCVYTAASDASVHDTENDADLEGTSERALGLFKPVCIKNLDCFEVGSPFYHPIYRPMIAGPTKNLKTRFLLYTPKNPKDPQVLNMTEESLKSATLYPCLETKILIHGYLVQLPDYIFFKVKDELLKSDPMNVIIVDWTSNNQFPYYQAVANSRAVGAQVAKMINYYVKTMNLNPANVHVIGHSLGGQMAGYVGERVPGLGRITGLDPAGPLFHKAPPKVRLDKSDAKFVDVIHTNGGELIGAGLGLNEPIGHMDFFPNGGKHQIGCSLINAMLRNEESNRMTGIIGNMCSHNRAIDYFLESINNCRFVGVACNSFFNFQRGKCTPGNSVVAQMGLHATKVPTKPGKTNFYLATSGKTPYCMATNKLK